MSDASTLNARVGNSFRYGVQVHDPTLADSDTAAPPRDLTGATISTMIRNGPTQGADPAPTAAFTIANRHDTRGAFELQLPEDHALSARDYWYELEIEQSGMREPVLIGKLVVTAGFV